jgi:DNA-binding transcriptional ArsR family regulator
MQPDSLSTTFAALADPTRRAILARLVERGQQAQWRPRRLSAGPLREVAEWVGQYRPHWDQSFERLDAYLRREAERAAKPSKTKGRRQ